MFSWQFKLINGGMTGYALFFSYIFSFKTGVVLFTFNAINIFLSFTVGGQKIGFKAVYGFIFTGIMIELTKNLLNLQQIEINGLFQNILFVVFNGILSSIGVYLCIQNEYSTGSFSTLYLVFKKFYPKTSAPLFMSAFDILLSIMTFSMFGVVKSVFILINSIVFYMTMKLLENIKAIEYITKKMI